MKSIAHSLIYLLLVATGLTVVWVIDHDGIAQAKQSALPISVDPELLATALELKQLELTKPAAPQRTRDQLKKRSRAPLPTSQPLKYTSAKGTWTWSQPGRAPQTQSYARTNQRIALEVFPSRERWVFERNPVAPLAGSGTRAVEHEELVVEATWPEALDMGLGPTWNELACLGLSNPELEQLRSPSTEANLAAQSLADSGESTTAFGLQFHIFKGPNLEVHWNRQHSIAAKIMRTTPDGFLIGELTQLSLTVPSMAVETPQEQNPTWQQVDLSDWREEHHETH